MYKDYVELWAIKSNFTESITTLGYCDDLVDMDIYNNKIFVLSAKNGIGVVSLLDFSLIFYTSSVEGLFRKIKIYN
jgi:hypothetical protein